jgi:hypothetical protein
MKIYINGQFIGEILGRMSLSRLPILLRVKAFDITDKLVKGKNIVTIEAVNYDGYRGAINIHTQIQLKDGSIEEINTDTTWKCFDKDPSKKQYWHSLDFDDSEWVFVKSYGRPPNLNGEILKPNLLKGEISLTQDYYGVYGYFYNGLNIFMNKYLVKMFKFLIPIIIRRAKIFG